MQRRSIWLEAVWERQSNRYNAFHCNEMKLPDRVQVPTLMQADPVRPQDAAGRAHSLTSTAVRELGALTRNLPRIVKLATNGEISSDKSARLRRSASSEFSVYANRWDEKAGLRRAINPLQPEYARRACRSARERVWYIQSGRF